MVNVKGILTWKFLSGEIFGRSQRSNYVEQNCYAVRTFISCKNTAPATAYSTSTKNVCQKSEENTKFLVAIYVFICSLFKDAFASNQTF
jgi:hypothetical protein